MVAVPEPEPEYSHHDQVDQNVVEDDSVLDLDIPVASTQAAATKKAKSKRGRASIPSWDEILFGATKTPKDD